MLDGARIFHVNVNCSDLATSRSFYVDRCGLSEGVRTTPAAVQSGVAFGLERARWDAWILVGGDGFAGGAIDLLEWQEPPPGAAGPEAGAPGFSGIGIARPGGADTVVGDPDGVRVELVAGSGSELAFVVVTCADRDRSRTFYDALGFELAASGPDASGRVPLDAPGGGPVRLVLDVAQEHAPAASARPAHALGIWRVALLVPDLDAATAVLRAAGAELLSGPQTMAMGPGLPDLRFVCGRGPDLEVIELIETPTPTDQE